MLRDTVATPGSPSSTTSTRAARWRNPKPAGVREMWAQFAELGLLGASFSEAEGGFGGGPIEAMIISEEFGKGLVIEPYLQTVIIGGDFLRYGGTDAQKEEHIAGLIGGETIFAFAYSEPKSASTSTTSRPPRRRSAPATRSTATRPSSSARPSPRTSSSPLAPPAASATPAASPSSSCRRPPRASHARLPDRRWPARLRSPCFENVSVDASAVIGEVDNGLPLIENVVDNAIAALCAEAVGCFKVLNEPTISYAKQRKQFGQPIANFQVLQHRMVDMFMACEQAISMTYMVTLKLDEADKASASSPPPAPRCRSARPASSSARTPSRFTAAWA